MTVFENGKGWRESERETWENKTETEDERMREKREQWQRARERQREKEDRDQKNERGRVKNRWEGWERHWKSSAWERRQQKIETRQRDTHQSVHNTPGGSAGPDTLETTGPTAHSHTGRVYRSQDTGDHKAHSSPHTGGQQTNQRAALSEGNDLQTPFPVELRPNRVKEPRDRRAQILVAQHPNWAKIVDRIGFFLLKVATPFKSRRRGVGRGVHFVPCKKTRGISGLVSWPKVTLKIPWRSASCYRSVLLVLLWETDCRSLLLWRKLLEGEGVASSGSFLWHAPSSRAWVWLFVAVVLYPMSPPMSLATDSYVWLPR